MLQTRDRIAKVLFRVQARATWDEAGMLRMKKKWSVTLLQEKRRGSVLNQRLSIVSSSPPSWALFMCAACAVTVGSVGVVAEILM